MLDLLQRHRHALRRLLLIVGVGAPLLITALALTVRAGDWSSQRFLLVYVAPLFAYGAAWARWRLDGLELDVRDVVLLDGITFVAGGLRVAGGWGVLPYSGHMLFLTYAALVTPVRALRFAAIGLLAMTTWFKLALWHDWRSWSLGLAGGVALAIVRAALARRRALAPAA